MTTYRVGGHWGVTIVREGTRPYDDDGHRTDDELVAVVVNGDRKLAERICGLLNADAGAADAIRGFAIVAEAAREMTERRIAISAEHQCGPSPAACWSDSDCAIYSSRTADSCTCAAAGPDPACIVHEGRRARGPKPPPVGPGCICDGSGRACPRHGVVI